MGKDIFGKSITDYPQYKKAIEQGIDPLPIARREGERVYRQSFGASGRYDHDFSLSFDRDAVTQATVGSEPWGLVSDNLSAFQQAIMRVRYQRFRLDQWVPFYTDMDEGDEHVRFPIMDFEGEAGAVDDEGTALRPVRMKLSQTGYPLVERGAIANYTRSQLRNAQRARIPLRTDLLDWASGRCFRDMEKLGLMGMTDTNPEWAGLINQPTRASASAADPEKVIKEDINLDFTADSTSAEAIGNRITEFVTDMIEDSNGLIGEEVVGELVIGLPGKQLSIVNTHTLNDKGSDISIREHVIRHNDWNDLSPANSLTFARIRQLNTANRTPGGTANTPLMIAWVRAQEVLQFGVAIMPRVAEEVRKEFSVNVPLEYKCAPALAVLQPLGMRYGYGI